MNPERSSASIRRILLALDAATHRRRSFDLVAELATRLQAEIAGLFIEDTDLLRSAQLPCVRQLSLSTGADESLETEAVEGELRALADTARNDLASSAELRRVKWSFSVVRGKPAAELAGAAELSDLLVVESNSRRLTRYVRLNAPVRGGIEKVGRSVLVLRPGARSIMPVAVLYDGARSSDTALTVAARLSGPGSVLVILTPAAVPADERRLRERAAACLDDSQVGFRCRRISRARLGPVRAALDETGAGLLVIAGKGSGVEEGTGRLLEELDCPVLLVR